jgi:hypothetical protein
LADWDNVEFDTPVEFSYYALKYNCDGCIDLLDSDDKLSVTEISMAFSLYKNGIYKNDIYDRLNIINPKNFFNTLIDYIEANLFHFWSKKYSYADVLYGIEDRSLNIIRSGSIYDNFNPNIKKTKGFNFEESIKLTLGTGKRESDIGRIIKINDKKYLNQKVDDKIIPFSKNLMLANDGSHYNTKNDTIYYYDNFSSNIIEFQYSSKETFNEIGCYYYTMNNEKIYNASAKFYKPYYISDIAIFMNDNFIINNYDQSESYICIDPFSKYVVSSKIVLIVKSIEHSIQSILTSIRQ